MYHIHTLDIDLKDKSPLAWHVLLKIVGVSMISLFLPAIWISEYGLSLSQVFMLEGAYSLFMLVFMYTMGLPLIARHGTVVSMFLGVIIFAGNFVVRYLAKTIPRMIYLSPLMSAGYSAFFWPAYHTSMALGAVHDRKFASHNTGIESIGVIAALLGPLIGGMLADKFGSNILYGIAIVFLLLSCIPFAFHHRKHTRVIYKSSLNIIRSSVSKPFVKTIIQLSAALGYIDFVAGVVWPIILFSWLHSYTKVALVSFSSSLALIIVLRILGKRTDAIHRISKKIEPWIMYSFWGQGGTRLIAAVTFIFGLFSQLILVCIDTLHKVTAKLNNTYVVTNLYEHLGHTWHLQDILDIISLRELALHGTKIIICSILALIALHGSEGYSSLISALVLVCFMIIWMIRVLGVRSLHAK